MQCAQQPLVTHTHTPITEGRGRSTTQTLSEGLPRGKAMQGRPAQRGEKERIGLNTSSACSPTTSKARVCSGAKARWGTRQKRAWGQRGWGGGGGRG